MNSAAALKWTTWTTCQDWGACTRDQRKRSGFVTTLTRQHEWGPLGKLWRGWVLPTQQHSAHPAETAVSVRLALWIPKDVPLWLSSKLPPPLSPAIPQAPREPKHRPAEALHLGTHSQVVLIIRSLSWSGEVVVVHKINTFWRLRFRGLFHTVTLLNLNKLNDMLLFQDLIGNGACLRIRKAAFSRHQNVCHGFAVTKKSPIVWWEGNCGKSWFCWRRDLCHLNGPRCSCNERECLVLCLRCLVLDSAGAAQVK